MFRRAAILASTIALAALFTASPAAADVRVGPAKYTRCPGSTAEEWRYRAADRAPYRCHSAVVDQLGNTVILRQGRSDASGSAFGWMHALQDHNVDDHVIERIVSSAYPITAPKSRFRYIAELRVDGHGVMTVWVEVDRRPSQDAPDRESFGVVTAYCKLPVNASPENMCPGWVNNSLLP